MGAKKGVVKKGKKRSGRPASLHTQKIYSLCVFKDGRWIEAIGETEEELEVFNRIKDPQVLQEFMSQTPVPKDMPANLQWEKSALKVLNALSKESEYEFFDSFDYHIKELQITWDHHDPTVTPTNLSIIRNKLFELEYFSIEDWVAEMKRMFENATKNKEKDVLVKAAGFLTKKFNEEMTNVFGP